MKKNSDVIVIDNFDSFTFNLVQYFQMIGREVEVFRNDAMTAADVIQKAPALIVLSPGPSDPDHAGICLEIIKLATVRPTPILGVCLGHQAIGQACGGKVVRAPVPVHGKTADVVHQQEGLFRGLPSPLQATRYHSLVIDPDSLSQTELAVTATTPDGIIMGVRHRTLPIEGVQFHPESVLTQHGLDMLRNAPFRA